MNLDDLIHPVTLKAKLIIAAVLLLLIALACYFFGVLVFIAVILAIGSVGLLVINKTHPEVIKRLFGGSGP